MSQWGIHGEQPVVILLTRFETGEPIARRFPGNVEPRQRRNQQYDEGHKRDTPIPSELNQGHQGEKHPALNACKSRERGKDRGENPAATQSKIETRQNKESMRHVSHRRCRIENMKWIQRDQREAQERRRAIGGQLQSNLVDKDTGADSENCRYYFAGIKPIADEDVDDG